jgi:hypothetical protein
LIHRTTPLHHGASRLPTSQHNEPVFPRRTSLRYSSQRRAMPLCTAPHTTTQRQDLHYRIALPRRATSRSSSRHNTTQRPNSVHAALRFAPQRVAARLATTQRNDPIQFYPPLRSVPQHCAPRHPATLHRTTQRPNSVLPAATLGIVTRRSAALRTSAQRKDF